MIELYADDVLRRSAALYQQIKRWGAARKDVTLLGGWAVYELVGAGEAQQSRDVDLALHSLKAAYAFDSMLPTWGLAWHEEDGVRYKECHLADDPRRFIWVDVFTPKPMAADLFGKEAYSNVKECPAGSFVPPLLFVLQDKVRTVPLRQSRDAMEKKVKDLLDIHHLVYHNREGALPKWLAQRVDQGERHEAAHRVEPAIARRPEYETELRDAGRWLLL